MTGGLRCCAQKANIAVSGRVSCFFGNVDCEMAVCNPAEQMNCHFKTPKATSASSSTSAQVLSTHMMGTLKFGPKDYIIIPKGVIYTLIWDKLDTLKDCSGQRSER